MLPKVKNETDSMLRQSVISPVTVSTEWCSGTVPVPKPNGRVRICVDLTPLNKAMQRETHTIGSVEESLAMLGESRVFTKFDANSGFWQILLDDGSKLLTMFITPSDAFAPTTCPLKLVPHLKYFGEPCQTSWRTLMESYDLTSGDSVLIRDQGCLAKIQERTQNPSSSIIETENGIVRRNRPALVKAEL